MNAPWARVRRAAGATFAVHAVKALVGIAVMMPCLGLLSAPLGDHVFARELSHADAALLLEAYAAVPARLGWRALAIPSVFGLYLIAQPLLSMFWLQSLCAGGSAAEALRVARQRYLPAVVVSLGWLIGLAVALAVVVGLPGLVRGGLASGADARLVDLISLGLMLPGLMLLWLVFAWHDLARAALVSDRRLPARALGDALRATNPGAAFEYALLGAAGALVTALTLSLSLMLQGPSPVAAAGVMALQQCGALAATFLRGRWLASAVQRTLP